MADRIKVEWFGTPGHFICGRWCRFHLCTVIGGKFLVSTVGEYVHPRHSGGGEGAEAEWLKKNWPGEDIGCGRKYETMVFKAGKPCAVKSCGCGLPEIDGSELDFAGYNERAAAAKGHHKLVQKYIRKAARHDR